MFTVRLEIVGHTELCRRSVVALAERQLGCHVAPQQPSRLPSHVDNRPTFRPNVSIRQQVYTGELLLP